MYSKAVLHIKSAKDYKSVEDTTNKVINGLTANAEIFTLPSPAVPLLQTKNTELHESAIKALNGNHADIVVRDAKSTEVLNLLKQEVIYVNEVAKGDRSIIALSGFDSNEERTPVPMPGKVVIRKAEFGPAEHSVKFYIETLEYAKYYKIQKSTTPTDPKSWVQAADNLNTRNLVASNLNRGEETSFRITGGNSHGWGEWSEPISFIPK